MSILDLLTQRKKNDVNNESEFRVEDRGYEKILKYGDITYSKIRGGGIYTQEYWDYFIPAAYAFPNPKILLIGLGGGTVAFQLTSLLQNRLEFDAVETSRKAVELSKSL